MTVTSFSDQNISPAFFKDKEKLAVASIFFTIQGEGPFAGSPAMFLRLSGCNRGNKVGPAGCDFCDASFEVEKTTWMDVDHIWSTMTELSKDFNLIVITGGEPLLQKVDLLIENFAKRRSYLKFQFETNGDYYPEWLNFEGNIPDQAIGLVDSLYARGINYNNLFFVISPKIGNGRRNYSRVDERWAVPSYSDLVAFKILISADPESPYHELPDFILNRNDYGFDDAEIFLSPLTEYSKEILPDVVPCIWDITMYDRERCKANYSYAAQLAIKYGLRLSLQTHLLLNLP